MILTPRLPNCWRSWRLSEKKRLLSTLRSEAGRIDQAALNFERYRADPCAYARDILQVHWWEQQRQIATALVAHKRVFVKASHSVGKSHLAGGLVNWFFDCYDPGICLTTAPTFDQVVDILWKEVRTQRRGRTGLLPKAPRMETSPAHFAAGLTARDDSAFQGRHEEFVLIVFDEAVGVEPIFWDAAEGMMTGQHCYWLAICNPTDTSSRAYEESLNTEKWHVLDISAMEHPNIAADLAGLAAPIPAAVRLEWILGRLAEWCDPLPAADKRAGDIEFPPGSGKWYRPGPLFESRVLGRWPTLGAVSVWSDALWQAAQVPQGHDPADVAVIGCDVARFGDDFTSIVVRRGRCVVWHETHNGWSTVQTSGRLKQLAREYSDSESAARLVAVQVDDDGVGGGVVDQGEGWNFLPVSGASRANEADGYPNLRSEQWFAVADRAARGGLDLSRLSVEQRALLRRQLLAPIWKLDAQGRRVVEPKADTKKRIGRSPDDADALNLAFTPAAVLIVDPKAHETFWGGDEAEDY